MKRIAIAITVLLLATPFVEAKHSKREHAHLKDLPPAAQAAIEQNLGDGKVTDIEKELHPGGGATYFVEITMQDKSTNVVSVTDKGEVKKVKKNGRLSHRHRPLFG